MTELSITRRKLLATGAAGGALAVTGLPFGKVLASDRRVLKVGMSGFPPALEPVMYTQTATRRVVAHVFDTLITFEQTEQMPLRPGLAERWERVSDKALRLFLRKGVTFHDGSPFTAEDVAFSLSLEHIAGPGRSSALEILDTIDRVEVIDDFTVIVHAKVPDALLEKRLGSWGSEIVSKKAFDAAGSWDNWIPAPVGTGPYKIVSQSIDVNVVLTAHDGYWGGLPPYAGIEYRIIPQMASRINALTAGEVDFITDLSPDMFPEIDSHSDLEVVGGPVQNTRYLGVDTTGPILSKLGVRQALSLALDRKTFVETLWQGRVSVPNGFQLPGFGEGYIEDFPALAYDPDHARSLLKEADYNGETITYKLLSDYYPNQVIGAQTMIEMWREVGINVEIQMMENWAQLTKKPVHAIYDSSSTAIFQDHLGHAWRVFGPNGALPKRDLWKNNEYFDLGAKLKKTADLEERRAIVGRMLTIINHDMSGILLHVSGQFYGKRKELDWAPSQTLDINFGPFNSAYSVSSN